MPVGDDVGVIDAEHTGGVAPLVDRADQPVEVGPPVRFSLPDVVAAGGVDQRGAHLLRIPRTADRRVTGEAGQDRRDVVVGRDGLAGRRGPGEVGDAVLECQHQQSVSQQLRRAAVVVVVVLDLLEHPRRLVGAAGLQQRGVARVLGDGVRGRGDVAGAPVVSHVQRLERLEPVRFGADANALAHHRKKVDQHVVAQQIVDLVLAHSVAGGQVQQCRLLVGAVVVDVHVPDSACGAYAPASGNR